MLEISENIFKSIKVLSEDNEEIVIREGDYIEFTTESGEVKEGRIVKFNGKDDKIKLTILPKNSECHEIWNGTLILEGSLKILR
jgi:hypothetical protein